MSGGSCRQSVGTCSQPRDSLTQLHLNQMTTNVTVNPESHAALPSAPE